MRWLASVINPLKIGGILSSLKNWLKKLLILKIANKLFSRLKTGIFSTIRKHITETMLSLSLSQSNEITVNQLIRVLSGDYLVLKRRWYCPKRALTESSNNIIEEFSRFMDSSGFDKRLLASKQILQKKANIRAVEVEVYLYKIAIFWGLKEEPTPMLNRFGFDVKSNNFDEAIKAWVKRQTQDIVNSEAFLLKGNNDSTAIDYADFVTDLLITINDNHFIDKNTITALDFYKMYEKFNKKNKENGRRNLR